MVYQHEVFISYRRSDTVGLWVRNHLAPRLTARMNDIAPEPVRIFWDEQIDSGSHWPGELKRHLHKSGLLLAVWSADYFRSAWCMAEWQSFTEREKQLGITPGDARLVYPIRYSDGRNYHPEAQATQCRFDFSELNYPDKEFRNVARYLDFDDLVRRMADDLVEKIELTPAWSDQFPIVEPPPLPPARSRRTVM